MATIIVKSISRLGRDYLLVGQYTEMIFPSCEVRFIAVNNNVDSLYGGNDFTPFVNLFNDFYAKDISRKIRSAIKSKAERGGRVATRAPYAYKKTKIIPKVKLFPMSMLHRLFNGFSASMSKGKGLYRLPISLTKSRCTRPVTITTSRPAPF